jgi:hypothetical protein
MAASGLWYRLNEWQQLGAIGKARYGKKWVESAH